MTSTVTDESLESLLLALKIKKKTTGGPISYPYRYFPVKVTVEKSLYEQQLLGIRCLFPKVKNGEI